MDIVRVVFCTNKRVFFKLFLSEFFFLGRGSTLNRINFDLGLPALSAYFLLFFSLATGKLTI